MSLNEEIKKIRQIISSSILIIESSKVKILTDKIDSSWVFVTTDSK